MTTPISKTSMNTLFSVFSRLLDSITRLSLYLSGIALFLLLFSYIFEVVMRYFFDMPTTWSYDLGKAFLCTSVMLALPDITRNRGNITIDVLLEQLPPTILEKVKQLITLVCFGICLATAWICFDETLRQYTANIETFWNNPVPKWWISSLIPFGFLLSGLQFFRLSIVAKNQEG